MPKHNADGSPKCEPYLRADTNTIAIVPESISDAGLIAQVKAGSISGLAYEYHYEKYFQTNAHLMVKRH
jgi:hypothetical protein